MSKNIHPTIRQIKTLQNINKGMSTRRAMIEAGYSIQTANKGGYFFKSPVVKNKIAELKFAMNEVNIDPTRIAKKLDKLLDAQKPFSSHTEPDKMIDDHKIQLETVKEIRDIWGIDDLAPGQTKRTITWEEVINTPKEDA